MPFEAGTNWLRSPAGTVVPKRTITSAWARRSETRSRMGLFWSAASTRGSTRPSLSTTGWRRAAWLARLLDDHADRGLPLGEVGVLLAGEIVVEPVDDEDADEPQCQGDDGEERDREPRLEGPRHRAVGSGSGWTRAGSPAAQRSANA